MRLQKRFKSARSRRISDVVREFDPRTMALKRLRPLSIVFGFERWESKSYHLKKSAADQKGLRPTRKRSARYCGPVPVTTTRSGTRTLKRERSLSTVFGFERWESQILSSEEERS